MASDPQPQVANPASFEGPYGQCDVRCDARFQHWHRGLLHAQGEERPCCGQGPGSAKTLNDRDQLIRWVALLAGEANQLAGARDHRAALRGATDAHAEPTAELE